MLAQSGNKVLKKYVEIFLHREQNTNILLEIITSRIHDSLSTSEEKDMGKKFKNIHRREISHWFNLLILVLVH